MNFIVIHFVYSCESRHKQKSFTVLIIHFLMYDAGRTTTYCRPDESRNICPLFVLSVWLVRLIFVLMLLPASVLSVCYFYFWPTLSSGVCCRCFVLHGAAKTSCTDNSWSGVFFLCVCACVTACAHACGCFCVHVFFRVWYLIGEFISVYRRTKLHLNPLFDWVNIHQYCVACLALFLCHIVYSRLFTFVTNNVYKTSTVQFFSFDACVVCDPLTSRQVGLCL